MATRKWKKTNHAGLRFFEHGTRKHGKKKDRYYAIRFRLDRQLHEYGIGWLSDGIPEAIRKDEPNLGFEDHCLKLLREYKGNIKAGAGPKSPKEKRDISEQEREQAEQERIRAGKEAITFDQFIQGTYFPQCKQDKKPKTYEFETMFYRQHIADIIGGLTFPAISPFHLEKIKKTMADKNLSLRYIQYALQIIRQVFNKAKRFEIYSGDNPTAKVKFPKPDNGRMRFLTHEEAKLLLSALQNKSVDIHDMTLLSLNCGLRWGEITNLTWQDIDLERGTLTIRDAKAGSRYAFLTEQAAEMIKGRERGNPAEYVFKNTTGGKIDKISHTFFRTVEDLGLNEGIDDPRLKVCFHTCRHSYASWLIEQGQDLYTVQKLLGHKTNVMTQRYSHISENKFKEAARALSQALKPRTEQLGQVVDFKH
jgi:integrase